MQNRLGLTGRSFDMIGCLGRGGFGEVYLAKLRTVGGLNTRVALKVLRTDLGPGTQAVQRLRDEARILARLNHPAILRVIDITLLAGRVALITEYVEGMDLDKCLLMSPSFGDRALLQALQEVACALDCAYHAEQTNVQKPLSLIHRDIKPSNIRVGRHGEVKLLDFGIARAQGITREAQTANHFIVGSMPYLAPERFYSSPLSAKSDVFALGVCLFEGLSGQRFFAETSPEFLLRCTSSPEHFSAYCESRFSLIPASISDELYDFLLQTLQFSPGDRPSAYDFSRQAGQIADSLKGRTLRDWARERNWERPILLPGELTGKKLQEEGHTGNYFRPESLRPEVIQRSERAPIRGDSMALIAIGGVGLFFANMSVVFGVVSGAILWVSLH